MRWIWDNRAWLLSGAGIALIGALYRLLMGRPSHGPSNALSPDRNSPVIGSPQASGSNITQTINLVGALTPSHAATAAHPYSEHPAPEEIRDSLERLPVYQRALTKDSFVGLKVQWRVAFAGLQQMSDEERTVFKTNATHDLSARSPHGCDVRARIDIDQFPRLKILHEGAHIKIAGEIGYVADDGRTIRLRNATISFDDRDAGPGGDVSSGTMRAAEGAIIVSQRDRPASEIRFDYLPEESPDGQGWELVMDQGPSRPAFSLATDGPCADRCLAVQGFGYRLDYIRQPWESPCKAVQFAAGLWDAEWSVAYAYVQMTLRDGRTEKNGWIAHKLGPMHRVSRLDAGEWTITAPGTPLAGTTWRSFRWILGEEVERTFGTDGGWLYKRLLKVRLRGPISITPIQLFE